MTFHLSPSNSPISVNRRKFLEASSATMGAVALSSTLSSSARMAYAEERQATIDRAPETLVKTLYQSFSDSQKQKLCFDWDYIDPDRGLLRTRVENNWKITDPIINSDFFTAQQRGLVKEIFEGIIHPDWHSRYYKQLSDDAGGFGRSHSVAIFGTPGSEKFEFVLTGRHTTLRCDGNTTDHVAFGGPIFYGHAARGDEEAPTHPGNVFWEQSIAANAIYAMLDGRQRKLAEVDSTPSEEDVGFRSANSEIPGISISDLSSDQKQVVLNTLAKLVEPFRSSDREEVQKCIDKQGGIDKLNLAFFTDDDIGGDKVWDNWRLEGPSFVWHFRGSPHVHVWVNVADDPNVPLNS